MFFTVQLQRLDKIWRLMNDVQAQCSHAMHVTEAVMGDAILHRYAVQ